LVLTELLPVVLAGVPVGIGCALGLAALARHTVLDGAAPFELGLGSGRRSSVRSRCCPP